MLTFAALGTIAVGLLLGLGLQDTAYEWRSFYLIGLLPLVLLSVFRRKLLETKRFEAAREVGAVVGDRTPFLEPWRAAHRRNLVLVGLFHMLRSIPLFGSTAWWAFYAELERGFTSAEIAFFIICAYGLGCIGYHVCGRAMERWGRKPTAFAYSLGVIVFVSLLFQVTSKPLSFVGLGMGVFFGLGMAPVMSAYATELFPTEIRGQAAAWTRNLFDIAGYVFGPALVGVLGDHATGAVGNIGDTCTLLVFLQLPTLILVARLPARDQGPRAGGDRPRRRRRGASVSPSREEELAALRRPFAIAVGCVLLAVVAIGLLVARFGANADRPAGIAERWLVAIGFPIERPERAPIGWFAAALALGVLITLGCVAVVRAATPQPT